MQTMLRSFAFWLLRVLAARLVTKRVARDAIDAVFLMLRGAVQQTDTEIDNALLDKLEASTDKDWLAEAFADWLEGRLPQGDAPAK